MHETTKRLYEAALTLKEVEGQTNVANLLGESPQAVKNWESRGVSKTGMIKAQKIIGCSAVWLETGVGNMVDLALLAVKSRAARAPNFPRVVGTAKCGDKGYYHDLEGGDGYLELESERGSIAIRIRGDSMYPAVKDGWYVVIEPSGKPTVGEYVLLKFKDGRKMVKDLVQTKSDCYIVESVNGGARLTAMLEDLDGIQAISAVVPPSKHKEW